MIALQQTIASPIKPWVEMENSSVMLTRTHLKLRMRCMPVGIHNNYTWEKRSGNISNPRIDGVNLSTLTLLNLRPEDAGEY